MPLIISGGRYGNGSGEGYTECRDHGNESETIHDLDECSKSVQLEGTADEVPSTS